MAFCGFAGGEQNRCIAAHSIGSSPSKGNPYCERYNEPGDAATKEACQHGPSFCTRFEATRVREECERALGSSRPSIPSEDDYCGRYEGTQGRECNANRTSFCYRFPKISDARGECCEQARFEPYERNGCKALDDPISPSSPVPGSGPWYCSILPTARGCSKLQLCRCFTVFSVLD